MKIEIKYDGKYPNLCRGNLTVIINGKEWIFPKYCLSSGGNVWFDDGWNEHVEERKWAVADWPEDFPEDLKQAVVTKINKKIEWGCCGGCI